MDVYNRYCKPDQYNAAFVVCASTGNAAVAVGGSPVHAAYTLTRKGIANIMDSDKNRIPTVFRNVRAVTIDEVSMMPSELTAQLDVRLCEIPYKLNKLFGGLDDIMYGDLRQLQPVKANEVYVRSTAQLKSITRKVPWHHLSYVCLTRVVRQKD